MGASDSFGRQHLSAAWESVFGRPPELWEIQPVQAVARLESGYGRGSYKNAVTGESAVINNWGATQCNHGPPCGDSCFEVTDHHADGSAYNWCYNRYDTPAQGAAAFLRIIKRIVDKKVGWDAALGARSTDTFVAAMKSGGYFEAPLQKYQDKVWNLAQDIASTLGEQMAVGKGFSPFSPSEGAGPDGRPLSPSSPASPCSGTRSTAGDGDPMNDPDTYPETD